jgi:hypothetical protein
MLPATREPTDFVREQGAAGPPKPPTTGGETTPAEDREYNALLAHIDAKKGQKPGSQAAGGAGKPGNPDPFGVKAANAAVLGTYDAQKAGISAQAGAEGDRAAVVASRRAILAQQQQEDAEIHARELDDAQRGFDSHMAEIRNQLDTVRNEKIDPSRLMKQDGFAFGAVLGGIFGGMYMGLNKLDHNPFLDDLNKTFDRDIAVQEKNLDNKQKGVEHSMNLLREQRATFKDNDLAKLATKRAMYEATGNAIEAEAGKYDQPIAQARAQQAIAGIDREKGMLDKQIREHAQLVAQQQAAAGAAQQRAALVEKRKAYADTYEKVIASGASPAVAESEAARQMMIMYGGGAGERPASSPGAAGADPVSLVPKAQQESAIKEREAHAKAEAGARHVDKLFASYDKTSLTDPRKLASYQASIAGVVKQNAGPGMSSDEDYTRFIEPNLPKWNDTAETLATKRKAITDGMRASVATPTLDQHAPGWRGPAPVKQFNLDGTPKN